MRVTTDGLRRSERNGAWYSQLDLRTSLSSRECLYSVGDIISERGRRHLQRVSQLGFFLGQW